MRCTSSALNILFRPPLSLLYQAKTECRFSNSSAWHRSSSLFIFQFNDQVTFLCPACSIECRCNFDDANVVFAFRTSLNRQPEETFHVTWGSGASVFPLIFLVADKIMSQNHTTTTHIVSVYSLSIKPNVSDSDDLRKHPASATAINFDKLWTSYRFTKFKMAWWLRCWYIPILFQTSVVASRQFNFNSIRFLIHWKNLLD